MTAVALANLDGWLDTMRQPGGYGGPVPHWWGCCYRYTGPGLDWRYEGLLAGYATLYTRTGAVHWQARLRAAVSDVLHGQRPDGSLQASRFEANPGSLGTPHEAAVALGLLEAARAVREPGWVRAAARILENLTARLWDPDTRGFNDRPRVPGRVPNKLATLAEALLQLAVATGSSRYADLAVAALDDVLRLQIVRPGHVSHGAVHQMTRSRGGDGRLFPYYNARIIPALVTAADVLGQPRYRAAADGIADFLERVADADGSFPQIIYADGSRVSRPRWVAGAADILRGLMRAGRPVPPVMRHRLAQGQLPSGGFRTAEGFGGPPGELPDFRDVTAAVGWNDKVLRWMAEGEDVGDPLPAPTVRPVSTLVRVGSRTGIWSETPEHMRLTAVRGATPVELYRWRKQDPWAVGSWEVLTL